MCVAERLGHRTLDRRPRHSLRHPNVCTGSRPEGSTSAELDRFRHRPHAPARPQAAVCLELERHYADALPRLVSLRLPSKRSANARRSHNRAIRAVDRLLPAGPRPSPGRPRPHERRLRRRVEVSDHHAFEGMDRPGAGHDHSPVQGLTTAQTAAPHPGHRGHLSRVYALVVCCTASRVGGRLASASGGAGLHRPVGYLVRYGAGGPGS